jgi:hypothetical protein
MTSEEHARLNNVSEYSQSALIKVSRLRRLIAENGYGVELLQKGSPVLLIEAARVINCMQSKRLAAELLLEIGIHDSELCPAYGRLDIRL